MPASCSELLRKMVKVPDGKVPIALGLEISALQGAIFLRTRDECGAQTEMLGRSQIVVVGCREHNLPRVETKQPADPQARYVSGCGL